MWSIADAFAAQCRRHSLKGKYLVACACGFVTDLAILKLGILLGLEPAWARVISLICAMHVTFCFNGFFVFKGFEHGRIGHQWICYMATNAFGNLCNLLVFTTLLSLHNRILSNHVLAVSAGGFIACCLNYAGTRLFVFKRLHVPRSLNLERSSLEPRGDPPGVKAARTDRAESRTRTA
jgi:putative flippase GtrA